MDRFPEYNVAIHEIHHRMKKDAPSGTALKLADTVLQRIKRKTEIMPSLNNRQIQPTNCSCPAAASAKWRARTR